MKISFAITICNEIQEIQRLIPFLLEKKRPIDEIVILFDEKNGDKEILEFLLPFNKLPNVQTWRSVDWNDNFADWKNKLNSYCTGDYIFQIDADEMISEYMIQNVYQIVELNPEIDLFYLPRINTVEGITDEHIKVWNWVVNEKGHINFPDWQGRLYRQKMTWYGKVHERIIGGNKFSTLPQDIDEYCIQHHKTIERQEKQNNFYNTI